MNNNAQEAIDFYTGIFKNSEVLQVTRNTSAAPGPDGAILIATLRLEDQELLLLNAGPHFKFTEAISFSVDCKDQEEVDYYWEKLTADGGQPSQCSWLKDKFGLSWQIVPSILPQLLSNHDKEKADKAMRAMMQMAKIDIAKLKEAIGE
jgi:predicted 3-demethylubiquinone-9 3-methyltransferase (glyoxalase superfamily)